MTLESVFVLAVPVVLAIAAGLYRPDMRRPMFWAGLLAVPVLLSSPLTIHTVDYPVIIIQILTLFAFGALAAALYEVAFSKYFRLNRSRKPLLWMISGPIIFLLGVMVAGQTVAPLIIAILVELMIILAIRRDLIWDVLFSGFAMAIFYTLLLTVLVRFFNTPVADSWLVGSTLSGLSLWGIPIEEVLIVALFGALWGPMYPAFKDLRVISS